MAKNGLHLITPTSIAYTGTSATVSANGSVTFSAVSSLSLNGVFSADYDNYMIVLRGNGAGSFNQIRLRASGSDATGSDYVNQSLSASSSTVAAGRSTLTLFRFGVFAGTQRGGVTGFFYGPYLTQPTAIRAVTIRDTSSAQIEDNAATHSLSTSYDGFTLFPAVSNISGRIAVYGMRK